VASAVAVHGVSVQAGGGVRTEEDAAALADAGVTRVVMGTAALEDPALVARVAARQPVAVGFDGRRGIAAVRGWLTETSVSVVDALKAFEDAGVEAAVVTEITRDGTLEGPDVEGLRAALAATALPLIASGGVGSLDDVQTLRQLDWDGRRLAGVIIGRALYEKRFTVAEALAAVASA
jgi:phosphoribosylformimino-5-aminoimidazole carboxamide ribotide isomerase